MSTTGTSTRSSAGIAVTIGALGVTGEAISQEIVRTLVGSVGLVLSVPLTTAVGVGLVRFARTTPRPPPVPDRPWDQASVGQHPG